MPPTPISLLNSPAGLAPPAFSCSSSDDAAGVVCVHMAGDLDSASSPRLRRTLREAQMHARLVVLDMRGLAFMDTSGVHLIVDASIEARRVGRRFVILRGPPNVDRLFTLTGTSGELETYDLDPADAPVQVRWLLAAEALLA
jgi:anti-anti-sigma factor